jgi:Tol biopolymer transport system component
VIEAGLPYVIGGNLFTLDTAGKLKRLTYLTTTHFSVEGFYSWSPDGKAIAFLLQISPDNKNISDVMPELSVLKMRMDQVTNLCLPGWGAEWSPDGKFLMINQGLNEQNRNNEVYLVDLEKKLAWKVAENAEGQGWMIEP